MGFLRKPSFYSLNRKEFPSFLILHPLDLQSISFFIPDGFEKEFLFVTAVGDMPNET